MVNKIGKSGQYKLIENVEYILRDKNGNVKQIFQPNKLTIALLKLGIVDPKANFLKQIPYLFGHRSNSMKIANLVTSAGKAGVASRINGSGAAAAFTFVAIGTGTTAAVIGDTTLVTEIASGGGSRAAASVSLVTTTVTNDTAQMQLTFTFSAGFAVTESGIFNAASVGTLLARQVFTAVNVVSGDSLQVTWQVKAA